MLRSSRLLPEPGRPRGFGPALFPCACADSETGGPGEKDLINANDAMSKEDAALDKKIKSICRGC